MDSDELERVLSDHAKYLAGNGENRANLRGADLSRGTRQPSATQGFTQPACAGCTRITEDAPSSVATFAMATGLSPRRALSAAHAFEF